jgi:hypothetical protein
MNRLALVLMFILPLALPAQERDSNSTANQTGAVTLQTDARSHGDNFSSSKPETSAVFGSEADATAQQQSSTSPSQPAKPRNQNKLVIPGSVVGYVDSAIISSQVRIRFDDAFHDSAPDRAEFFYAQCSCSGSASALGPNFPGASNNINFQQVYIQAEYAPVSRFSIFAEVPFRWIEPQPTGFLTNSFDPNATPPEVPSTQTNSGISDVRAGIKLSLAASSGHSLTFQLKSYFPSGNASLGLGTAHYSVEPSLLYYQQLSQRWAIESQLGDWIPIGGSMGELAGTQTFTNFAGNVFFYGIGPSYQLINGEQFKLAPVVELFGWYVASGQQTINPFPSLTCGTPGDTGCTYDAGGTNIVNLKVGLRASFGNHNSVYAGFGQAVTHAVWYEHIVRLEYRYAF